MQRHRLPLSFFFSNKKAIWIREMSCHFLLRVINIPHFVCILLHLLKLWAASRVIRRGGHKDLITSLVSSAFLCSFVSSYDAVGFCINCLNLVVNFWTVSRFLSETGLTSAVSSTGMLKHVNITSMYQWYRQWYLILAKCHVIAVT